MTRISFGLATALLCATASLAACDAAPPADVEDEISAEPTSEATTALTDVEECVEECEDIFMEDRFMCMRLGPEKPKYGACPSGVDPTDPTKCLGLNELCGIWNPPPPCHDGSCVPLNQQCANTHGPGLAALCDPPAEEQLESCSQGCVPPETNLMNGDACFAISWGWSCYDHNQMNCSSQGTVVTGTYYDGYCATVGGFVHCGRHGNTIGICAAI